MKLKIITILTSFTLISSASAEEAFTQYIPQAPEAQAIARAIDVPVSLYTGIPNISLPLYEIKVGSYSLPITMNYYSGGIHVNQEATEVGLGWTLNAGGSVTRTVQCAEDFLEHPVQQSYFYKGYFGYERDWDGTEKDWVNFVFDPRTSLYNSDNTGMPPTPTLIKDVEPDIYFFHMPNCSGKMWFGHDKTAHYVNPSLNVKTRITYDNEIEMIDSKGNRYLFYSKERTRVLSRSATDYGVNSTVGGFDFIGNSAVSNGFKETADYTSSWKLSKIITVDFDTISFSYEKEEYQLPFQVSANTIFFVDQQGDISEIEFPDVKKIDYHCTKTKIQGLRLSKIEWKGGCIVFDSDLREDILPTANWYLPQKITNIRILDRNEKEIQSFDFVYGYFNDSENGTYSHLFKRLKLQELVDNKAHKRYSFTYNEVHPLPAKNSKNTDYWGYSNGSKQGDNYVCMGEYNGRIFEGGNKIPNEEYAKSGILESIKHPTGGVTKFTYESNKADVDYFYTKTRKVGGWLVAFQGDNPDERDSWPNEMESDTIILSAETKMLIKNELYCADNISVNRNNYYKFFTSNDSPFSITAIPGNSPVHGCVFKREIPPATVLMTHCPEYIYLDTTIVLSPGTYVIQSKAVYRGYSAHMYYECEQLHKIDASINKVGGLRVKSIEGEKNVTYQYEDGKLLINPRIATLKEIYGYYAESTDITFKEYAKQFVKLIGALITMPFSLFHSENGVPNMKSASMLYFCQHSESVRPLSTFNNGYTIGYSVVRETFEDGTTNEYTYYNEKEKEMYELPGYENSIGPTVPSVYEWQNGLLLGLRKTDKEGTPLQSTENCYDNYAINDSIFGYKDLGDALLVKYCNYIHCPLLVRSVDTVFYGGNSSFVSIKTKEYNRNWLCSKEVMSVGNSSLSRIYNYPFDFDDSMSKKMVSANMVGIPVATLEMRNSTVFSGKKTLYGEYNGMLLPKAILSLNTDKASTDVSQCKFDTSVVFKNYTKYGNPQELDFRGTPVSYLWGYKGMYPVAEYKNATYETLSSCGMNVREEDVIDDFHVSDSRVSALRHLTGNKEPIAVTTCRYQPLVGVTEITAPTGLLQTFKYDDAGRLSHSLLGNSELHKAYRYHYADEADTDNYEETIEYLNAEKADSIGSIQYYDIWGRSSLTSVLGVNTSGKNLWSWQTYDNMGRPDRSWTALPNKDRLTEENFADASNSFFGDAYAYSQTTYDALGRTLKVTTPGKKWHDKNRATENSYNTNGYQEVRKYKVIGDAMTDAGYYGRNTLTCTTLKDPDGNMSSTYKDMFGNVVLERRGGDHDTYYVYDDYNRLRFVLSPKYQDEASLDKFAYEYRYDGRGNVIYKKLPGCKPIEYEYDKADRVISMEDGEMRRTSQPRYYTYDGLGRMKVQYSVNTASPKYKKYQKYLLDLQAYKQDYLMHDGHCRLCPLSERCVRCMWYIYGLQPKKYRDGDSTYVELPRMTDSQWRAGCNEGVSQPTSPVHHKGHGPQPYVPLEPLEMMPSPNHDMTAEEFWSVMKPDSVPHPDTLFQIINFYDDYGYLQRYADLDLSTETGKVLGLEGGQSMNAVFGQGQLTGTWQLTSDSTEMLTTYVYDERGRMVRQAEIGLDKRVMVRELTYNFAGDVTAETEHYYTCNQVRNQLEETLRVRKENKYEASHTKLLTSSVITINDITNGKTMTDTIHKPTYDEFGRIVSDDRSGMASDMVYEYDKLHGWLTSVKGGHENKKYRHSMIQNLYRETGSAKPCWNGSISAMEWSTIPLELHRYDYYYDGLNRLQGSVYSTVYRVKYGESSENAAPLRKIMWEDEEEEEPRDLLEKSTGTLIAESDMGEIMEYDANSNITSIKRYGYNPNKYGNKGVLIDDLEISYNGNQKTKVDDFAETVYHSGAFDFKDDADQEVEYSYDENGNLIYDANKDLHFKYDLFGHIVSVEGSKCSIEYVYSADGRKLRTIHNQYVDVAKKKLLTTTQKDYQGNLIYKNGLPEMYQFDGGYYAFVDGILKDCYFYIKDYQGNIRLLANNKKSCSQRLSYYPFGTTLPSSSDNKQDFKYSGKELDRTYGLDLYDFHARQYDPVLGCFNGIDPLAEKTPQISPYSYCGGDPVNCVDPDGKATIFIGGNYISPFDKASSCYWPDDMLRNASKKWGNTFIFKDGSLGGTYNLWSTVAGFPILANRVNCYAKNRYNAGYNEGMKMARDIIINLKCEYNWPIRKNVPFLKKITETLQIITHSMGGAYGQGFAQAIINWCKLHPSLCEGLQLTLYHFSPFQAEDIPAIKEISVFQLHHRDDTVAPYAPINGALQLDTKNSEGGHTIKSYKDEILGLPSGRYIFHDGHFVPVDNMGE